MEKHKNQRFCVPKRVQNSHLDNAGMMSSVPGKLTWGFKVRTTKKSAFAEDLKKKVKASGACSAQFAVGVPRPTSKDPRIPAEPVCAGQPGHSQSWTFPIPAPTAAVGAQLCPPCPGNDLQKGCWHLELSQSQRLLLGWLLDPKPKGFGSCDLPWHRGFAEPRE